MSHLLKGNKVFVDTTEFSGKLFDLKHPSFVEFSKLCKNKTLVFLTTDITKQEIGKGVRLIAEKSCDAITRASEAALILKLPIASQLKEAASTLKAHEFAKKMEMAVDEFFLECKATTLYPPAVAIDKVFKLFFNRNPPFAGGKKKNEFPDAFVIQALETVPTPDNEVVYVISDDADFASSCAPKNPNLHHLKSLEHLLDLVNRHEFFVTQIRATIQTRWNDIRQQLEEILNSLPAELHGHPGTVQIESFRVNDVATDLIVSCVGKTASVAFPCFVEIDAMLGLYTYPDEPPAYRSATKQDVVTVTLQFEFDPKNPNIFSLTSYWAPSSWVFEV